MKFRDTKNGNLYEHIRTAHQAFCFCRGCEDCPIRAAKERTNSNLSCVKYAANNICHAAQLMGYEIIEEEETMDQKKQERPRICEILGVEVGEDFKIPNLTNIFGYNDRNVLCHIDESGHLIDNKSGNSFCTIVLNIINYPESIIRKPKFTENEIAIFRATGAKWATIDVEMKTVSLLAEMPTHENAQKVFDEAIGSLSASLFPSIRNGDLVDIDSLLNGREESAVISCL